MPPPQDQPSPAAGHPHPRSHPAAGGTPRMVTPGREARWLWFVFLLALAVRLVYLWDVRDLPTLHHLVMDAERYDALARRILAGGWRPHEAFYQAPLYPYLLAATYAVSGGSLLAVRLGQALLGALTAVLAAVAAGRLGNRAPRPRAQTQPTASGDAGDADGDGERRRLALLATAGVLAALYAPAIFYTPLLLKTVPALLLESAALVALLPPAGRRFTPARCLGIGALLGAASLLQESLLPLVPATVLYLLARPWPAAASQPPADETTIGRTTIHHAATSDTTGRNMPPGGTPAAPTSAGHRVPGGAARRPWLGAAAVLVGAALALAPAALLNLAASGQLLLTSSQSGVNFYIGNARGATGTYSGLSGGGQTPERQKEDSERLAALFAARDSGRPVAPASLAPAQVSRILWRETWRQIVADPATWGRLMLRKLRLFWNNYELPDAEGFRVYRRESLALRLDPLTFGPLAPLAAVGLLSLATRGTARERHAAALLALLTLTVCAAVVLFFVFGRYRLAVVPFLLPLAAAGIQELREIGHRASQAAGIGLRRPAADLALLAGVGLAVNLPCYSATEIASQDSAIECNLGTAAMMGAAASHADFRRLVAAGAFAGKVNPSATADATAPSEPITGPAPSAPTAGAAPTEPATSEATMAAARAKLTEAVELASRAVDYLAAADADSPDFVVAKVAWANALADRGRYLAEAGNLDQALADVGTARDRLTAVLAAPPADPELQRLATSGKEAIDDQLVTLLSNAGLHRIETGQLDDADALLTRATAVAPNLAAPRGSLALCRLQRGLAARHQGDRAAAARLLAESRDLYRTAVALAQTTDRPDLATLFAKGQTSAEAALADSTPQTAPAPHR